MTSDTTLAAFARGFFESHRSFGLTYDADAESPRSRAYDTGREAGELLVLLVAALETPGDLTDEDRNELLERGGRFLERLAEVP